MSVIERFHSRVAERRVRVLSNHLGSLMPAGSQVLDIGCGDGLLASLIMQDYPGVQIKGADVLVREKTHIPVECFDGAQVPHEDNSFDIAMLVDVLHHSEQPLDLLREAKRVARSAVVIKDHFREGLFAGSTLRFMDWVGNARFGVALPHNYWSRRQWHEAIEAVGLTPTVWKEKLGLYAPPANLIFERSLHFIVRLDLS
ncbi:MAG TPA: class I SAM-dependent methyltransferase [Pyrinomonadaceae bacterium]|nr:class I SAM-dependent methyltransferase [Pyrinomonadaceae bacterium]